MADYLFVKQLDESIPRLEYKSTSAAGLDIAVRHDEQIDPFDFRVIPTGIAIAPSNEDCMIRLTPRSSTFNRYKLLVLEGVIDSDYRGEIFLQVKSFNMAPVFLPRGTFIAQLIVQPIIRPNIKHVPSLDTTARGSGGFGSTDEGCPQNQQHAVETGYLGDMENGYYPWRFWYPESDIPWATSPPPPPPPPPTQPEQPVPPLEEEITDESEPSLSDIPPLNERTILYPTSARSALLRRRIERLARVNQ